MTKQQEIASIEIIEPSTPLPSLTTPATSSSARRHDLSAGQLSLIRSLADLSANSVRAEFPTETLEMAALVFDRDPNPIYVLSFGAGSRDDGLDAWKQFFLAQPDQRLSYLLPRSCNDKAEPAPE